MQSNPHPPARVVQIWHLVGFLILSLLVSSLGGWLTAGSIGDWYPTLAKPGFNPPDWVFAPVWSTLFLLMAIAAWRVWRRVGWAAGRTSQILYFAQLVGNLAWSALFFGLQRPGLALVDCALLLILIIATTWQFRRHDGLAALLMLPYIAWVAFACVLNGAIVALN
ncbi:TspO/MBR family protein [Dongia sp.]|uniref:TspO/MBR family protein n=1 Tax=Dongia sp. TaxID=1977262 RepID=UPI0035B33F8B